ncbi:hypothetical protein NDU88_001903 [Pleurodeles waltl]|uniref:Uncharacterized protein n=1 Tax=Pleurodeles waltl TaxID=8319 RepID=A0AAV7SB00_PLEWA|nr:hypothetical protein NDU88_001903 [Pleurodeles waltl]
MTSWRSGRPSSPNSERTGTGGAWRKRSAGADRPARTLGQDQDILTCLHYYKQREAILTAVSDQTTTEYEGHRIGLIKDLSFLMLQHCRTIWPVTDHLREREEFRLQFTAE